jgi:hypothetical protein
MRRKISLETWQQVDIAVAAGVGLREIARNMNIPAGTILAHAKRKGLTQQIRQAKNTAQSLQPAAITPLQSVAVTMQQRAERYTERMAGVSERVMPHLESLDPAEILDNARNLEQFDRVSRRTFGLDSQPAGSGPVSFNFLMNQSAVQVIANLP